MRRHSVRRRVFLLFETTTFRDRVSNRVRPGRAMAVAFTSACIVLGSIGSAVAQSSLPLALRPSVAAWPTTIEPSGEQLAGIERWSRDYIAWKAWFGEWRNKREPSLFGTHSRRQRPDPPVEAFFACPLPSDDVGPLAQSCRLLDEWLRNDVAAEIITQQAAATRTRKENESKTIWWQHVHLDALWPMTQGTSGMYGVLGLHTTIDLTGRIELFLAPGAILMRVPGPSGNGEWKPATDWGFTYRLADFTMPRMRRPATLHVNLAKVWLFGGTENAAAAQNDMYLAGFSLTFRKMH
jgi:hypothetical protein